MLGPYGAHDPHARRLQRAPTSIQGLGPEPDLGTLQRHQNLAPRSHSQRCQEVGTSIRSPRRHQTRFATLDRLLARIRADRASFLKILERPDIPLHTNGSESDIRCVVTRRKISAGTQSDKGRDARDALLSLLKTCSKRGVSFWDYLGDRLGIPGIKIPPLADLVAAR